MKKILLKSLSGFTLGITLLVIAYASIYFISGENTFIAEIQQLQNIKTLITQVIFSGIACFICSMSIWLSLYVIIACFSSKLTVAFSTPSVLVHHCNIYHFLSFALFLLLVLLWYLTFLLFLIFLRLNDVLFFHILCIFHIPSFYLHSNFLHPHGVYCQVKNRSPIKELLFLK